jgi:hypothetical protein
MTTQRDLAARGMDLAARSIDLLTTLGRVAQSSQAGEVIVKEIGRWLGKEGLDENELQFYLEHAHGLVRPNQQPKVVSFYEAVTTQKPKVAVVPLWAQPSGALGRLVARDPFQRWITSTISCLFRYHDQGFIKDVICALIMQSRSARSKGRQLSEYQLAWHPDTLRLGDILGKIVESNWLHIANCGIIGSPIECPELPEELSFACPRGHNIESHRLGLILSRLCDPPTEVIFQSELLLTNLTLWLLWHFSGRLRVVVSGRIVYDKELGEERCTVELRVAKFCDKDGTCNSIKTVPTFEMLGNVAGNIKKLFGGKYDSQQTVMSKPRARQRLYHSHFHYPAGSQNSIKIQTRRTAQEILKWLLDRPVVRDPIFESQLAFNIILKEQDSVSTKGLRVADLLGRTPSLLNMQCGELERTFVVFSEPPEQTPPTVEGLLNDPDQDFVMEDDAGSSDPEEDRLEYLLNYFPILQDLLGQVGQSCRCHCCYQQGPYTTFRLNRGCLQFTSLMEVMFFVAHGIADALGASDASSSADAEEDDFGVIRLLLEAIEGIRFPTRFYEGKIQYNTFLSTAIQVFLGCPSLEQLTPSAENDTLIKAKPNFMQHVGAAIVAVQYGNLAVVAPWLDISKPIRTRNCFRFSIAEGRLCLASDEWSQGPVAIQEVTRDIAVVETQHTEDVRDYINRYEKQSEAPGTQIAVSDDTSDEHCDYVLVSVDENRYKLLMRVSSNTHSRMVDPSRAILRISSNIPKLKCVHGPIQRAAVPANQVLELYTFDELVGRWSDSPNRDTDSPDDTSEETSENEGSDGPPEAPDRASPPAIRISHILTSSLKYNVAISLTGSDPIITNRGDACLECTLKKTINFQAENGLEKHGRWVINKAREPMPASPTPRLGLGISRPRAMVMQNPKAGVDSVGMEIDG